MSEPNALPDPSSYAPRFQAFRDPRDGRKATLATYADRDGVALRLETAVGQPDEGIIKPEWYLHAVDADARFELLCRVLIGHGYLPEVVAFEDGNDRIRFVGDPSDPGRPS